MTVQNEKNFDEYFNSSKPVVVKFFSLWGADSRALEETFAMISNDLGAKAVFIQCNVNSNPDLAERFHITKIPTIVVFKNQEVVAKISSMSSKRALKEDIETALRQ